MYNHANPEPGKVCNDFCNLSSRANRADFASNTSDRDMPTHQRRKALASRPREHNENLPSQITSDGGGGSSRDGRHGPAAARSAAARPADPRLAAGAGHCPSPLIGSGIDRNSVPAATHVQDYRDIDRRGVPDLLWSLNQEIGAVSIDSASGNPFQPSFNYRGFAASPLQGRPQGLAVYVNGMRFNQPFGDTVDWDLIPNNAIDSLNVEGSNPLFGLNALGGSVKGRASSSGVVNSGRCQPIWPARCCTRMAGATCSRRICRTLTGISVGAARKARCISTSRSHTPTSTVPAPLPSSSWPSIQPRSS